MIITKLVGGNGNQMFQYAAGFALAKIHNTRLLLDINYLLDKSKRYYLHENRDYALDMFCISASIATNYEISRFTVPRVGNKYLYHIKKQIFPENNVFKESLLIQPDDLLKLPMDAYIEGLWQKYKYLATITNDINSEFRFKRELPNHCKTAYKRIKRSLSVGLVIRRGDFVNHPFLDIVKLDYYYASIKIILDKLTSPVFFVFSDNISWCMENFKPEGCNYEFVDQSLTGPLAEYYLQLISSCDHFIIPNSTFAWWGAWLGRNHDKIIIAPAKWYKNQLETRNEILPDTWIAL